MHGRLAHRLLLLVAALTLLVAAAPAAAAAPPARAAITPATPAATLLFVQETDGGRIVRIGRDRYRLVLTGVSRSVETFTDRPARRAGQESVGTYVARWSARGFAGDPPNAALVVHDAPRSSDVAMLTLSRPRYDRRARTLTYVARPLRGRAAGGLARLRRRADPVRERSFGGASLFVDDAGAGTVYQQVVLQVSGAQPGQEISVQLTPNGGNVAWSMGPPYQVSGGIQVVAQSGSLPLAEMDVNASQATFVTNAGGGGGGSLTFNVLLFLVADADVGTFYLRSSSDPGIQVQAQIGDAMPQQINQTDTLFAWNMG